MSIGPTEQQGSAPPELVPSGPQPDAPSTLHWIFVGPNGIRAGWSILIFVALLFAIGAAVLFVLRHIPGVPRGETSAGLALSETSIVFTVLVATAIMARIEGRSVLNYGLRDRQWLRRFVVGALWGLVLISGLVGLLVATGHLAFDGQLLHGSTLVLDALALGFAFLMVGMAEEVLVRGYLQSTLARGIGFWPAAVLLSVGFGLLHLGNPGERAIGLVSAGTAGLVFCFALYRTGSLWWPIGAHAAWDWGQSYLYGVPDSGLMVPGHLMATHPIGASWLSGGTVGPEGSIFVLAAFGAIVPIIMLTTRRPGVPT
ncbi:MAG TPA: type II CAAX endopeptidase family protein [Gemmatimonadaceae bacterium]|jgi:membrane protease YdiL (CAAX protease family)|nr:type II CAAX endopeptidase family protein [Gemmatimonadaceae bacterium]